MGKNPKLFKNVTLIVAVSFLWSNVVWAGGMDFIAQATRSTDTLAAQTQAAAVGLAVRADVDALVMTKVLRALGITNMGALVSSFEKGKDPFGKPCLISRENEKKAAYYYFEQGKRKYHRVTTEENVNDPLNRLLQALNPACAPGVVIRAGELFEQGWLISEGQEEVFDSFLDIIYPGTTVAGVPAGAVSPSEAGSANEKGLFSFNAAIMLTIITAAWFFLTGLPEYGRALIIAVTVAVFYGLSGIRAVRRHNDIYLSAKRFPGLRPVALGFLLSLAPGCAGYISTQDTFKEIKTTKLSGVARQIVNAISDLINADEKDVNTREAIAGYKAIEMLGLLRDRSAVPFLLNLLKNPSAIIRDYAASALGEMGDGSAVNSLLDALDEEDNNVRISVMGALGKLGDKSKPVVTALKKIWINKREDLTVRIKAAYALSLLGQGDFVYDEVVGYLDRKGPEEQSIQNEELAEVLATLGVIGNTSALGAALSLTVHFATEPEPVRIAVVKMLGYMGKENAEAIVPFLLGVSIKDQSHIVRAATAEALGRLNYKAAIPVLRGIVGLPAEHPYTKIYAAQVLIKLGDTDELALRFLKEILKDPDMYITAIGALYDLGYRFYARAGDRADSMPVSLYLGIERRYFIEQTEGTRYALVIKGVIANPTRIKKTAVVDAASSSSRPADTAKNGNEAEEIVKAEASARLGDTRAVEYLIGKLRSGNKRIVEYVINLFIDLDYRLQDKPEGLIEPSRVSVSLFRGKHYAHHSGDYNPLLDPSFYKKAGEREMWFGRPSAAETPASRPAGIPSSQSASAPASLPAEMPASYPGEIIATQPGRIQTQYSRHVRHEDEKTVMILDVEHTGVLGGIKQEGNLERLREILAKTLGSRIAAEEAREIARQKIQDSLNRLRDKYQTGIFGAASQVVLVDNLGGIDSDGAAAELRDGKVYIDIDAFLNDRAQDDVTKHEFYERILKLVERNPGTREVTAIYQDLKDFAELKPGEKKDLFNFLSGNKNGLNSAEYGAVLRYISDNDIKGDELVTLAIGYVMGTKRYAHLRESLKGISPGDVIAAEQKLNLAKDIYTDLINARSVSKEALIGAATWLKPIIESVKITEAKAKILMKVRMTASRLNTSADFVDRLYADNRYVRLDMDELAKPGNEYIMQWLEKLLSGRTEEKYPFILFSSGGRTTLADLLAQYQKLSAGKFLGDSNIAKNQIPKESIATLYDLGSSEPNAGVRSKTLSVPLLYSDVGIYLAAEVAIAGGDINKISNPLIRNTLEAFYEPLFDEGFGAETLIKLFKGEIWPPIEKITALLNQDALRKAIAKAELEAAA